MKAKIGQYEWVVKEYEVPKKFENYFLKDKDKWTDEEIDYYDEEGFVIMGILMANDAKIENWESIELEGWIQ